MIELVSDGIIPNTHNKTWLIDTVSELSQLEVEFGNEAYCIADQTTYICNGQGNWVEKGGGGGGSSVEVEPLSVTTNGQYDAGEGKAYNPVTVEVIPALVGKTITENGHYIAHDEGIDGYDSVDVTVTPRTESLYANRNDIYTPTAGVDGFNHVQVDVQPNLKNVKQISENGTYEADAEGYDGYASVEVNTPGPTQFVSSGTIASPDANITSGSLIAAAFADHKYFELSFEFGGNTYVFPVRLSGGTGRAYLIGVGGGEVLMGYIEYDITNLQLSLQTIFLASMNTDGTGFVDMTSMLPTSTPATITGYYWN